MKRLAVSIVAILATVTLTLAGCAQQAPAPTPAPKATEPTKAPAAAPPAPTKAASAAQPTAAPAKKIDWPEKGKTITQIVSFGPGSGMDITARTAQPYLEKVLGVSMPVINKAGGGGQVGLTEFVKTAKPDGYTITWTTVPSHAATYLDPERRATFTRKDFQLVANYISDPVVLVVRPDSPYNSIKDLVDAGKANPGRVRITSLGVMTIGHVATVKLEKLTGAKFAHMPFEQQGEQRAALLGGHADCEAGAMSAVASAVKNRDLRAIAVLDSQPSKLLPDVKTGKEQGYDVVVAPTRGISVAAGTPKEISQILSNAIKTILQDQEHVKQLEQQWLTPRYMDTPEYEADWAKVEADVKLVLESAKK